MTFKTVLRDHLLADPAIQAITSQVHWTLRPQGSSLPAIVLSRASNITTRDLDGANGKSETRVQFSCFAETSKIADELERAVESACEGSFTRDGITVTLQGEPEGQDRGRNTNTAFIHESLLEMRLYHNG